MREYIDSTVPAMAVGEYWDTCEYTDGVLNYNQDSHRQRTISWCDQTGGTSAAFDFTLKGGSAGHISSLRSWLSEGYRTLSGYIFKRAGGSCVDMHVSAVYCWD